MKKEVHVDKKKINKGNDKKKKKKEKKKGFLSNSTFSYFEHHGLGIKQKEKAMKC